MTFEDFHRNPDLRRQLVQAAHHRRNEEIGRLFARLVRFLKPALGSHAARSNLASQG